MEICKLNKVVEIIGLVVSLDIRTLMSGVILLLDMKQRCDTILKYWPQPQRLHGEYLLQIAVVLLKDVQSTVPDHQ